MTFIYNYTHNEEVKYMNVQEVLKNEYVDSAEAAKMLNLSIISIRALCQRGRLNGAFRFGNAWIIPRISVQNRTKSKVDAKPHKNNRAFINNILKKNKSMNVHSENCEA